MRRAFGLALGIALAVSALGAPVLGAQAEPVEICHLAGHSTTIEPVGVVTDFYVSGPPDNPYNELLRDYLSGNCVLLGGHVLSVSDDAARHGHDAFDVLAAP